VEFERFVGTWHGFYSYLGIAAATVLGFLGVALTLRTMVLRGQVREDVRECAYQLFTALLVVVVLAGVMLVPHQNHLGVGLPLVLISAFGAIVLAYTMREFLQLYHDAERNHLWLWLYVLISLAISAIMFMSGLAIIFGVVDTFYVLAGALILHLMLTALMAFTVLERLGP
jgi:hypothetical protein